VEVTVERPDVDRSEKFPVEMEQMVWGRGFPSAYSRESWPKEKGDAPLGPEEGEKGPPFASEV